VFSFIDFWACTYRTSQGPTQNHPAASSDEHLFGHHLPSHLSQPPASKSPFQTYRLVNKSSRGRFQHKLSSTIAAGSLRIPEREFLNGYKMSFLLSWLGLRTRQAVPPHSLPSPPETPDSLSVIDKDEVIEDAKMIAFSETASAISQQILDTYASLLTLPDFYPSKKINSLLGALVPLCCETHDHRVVSQVLYDSSIYYRGAKLT
jgi:hypothetical protein